MNSLAQQPFLTRLLVTCSALMAGSLLGILAGLSLHPASAPAAPATADIKWEKWEWSPSTSDRCLHQHKLIDQIHRLKRHKAYLESFPGDVMQQDIERVESTIRNMTFLLDQRSCFQVHWQD